jgi:hypothetical protein
MIGSRVAAFVQAKAWVSSIVRSIQDGSMFFGSLSMAHGAVVALAVLDGAESATELKATTR